MAKKTVFMTGATGNMGWAGFKELLARKDRFTIRILARKSKKNLKKLSPYIDDPDVEIVWGDLMSLEDVKRGVSGSDFVLHLGGMVSPAADRFPEKTLKVNVLATRNVVDAILAQPDADKIRLVYVGSVAQYGSRMDEILWGRAGDPQRASLHDMYSVSKCKAEKIVVDSGIRHWVSLRQSGILYPGIIRQLSPTAFHVPVRGALEWSTVEDSGRVLANIVEDWVPEEFWNRFYNISSGESFRMSNYEFECRLLGALGLPGPDKVFEPQWFTLRNFHGMWYEDADELEKYLHFRENLSIDEYFARLKKALPWYMKFARIVPAFAVKLFMRPQAYDKELGTQYWVEHDPERFAAYYGSREAYDEIVSWQQLRPGHMEKNLERALESGEAVRLDHGYDESRSIHSLTVSELDAAAAFRGGSFLGPVDSATAGEPGAWTPGAQFRWKCERGHEFTASLEYVLLGGGWCDECGWIVSEPYENSENIFLNQVLR